MAAVPEGGDVALNAHQALSCLVRATTPDPDLIILRPREMCNSFCTYSQPCK
jgi:hypothetical protein